MYLLKRTGSSNIRLGNFLDDKGTPLPPMQGKFPGRLHAEVVQGKNLVDFPGTFSPVPLVVSAAVFHLLKEFDSHSSIFWTETEVKGSPFLEPQTFWVATFLIDELPDVLIEDEADDDRFYLRGDCDVSVLSDLIVDSSLKTVFSDQLAKELIGGDYRGFELERLTVE